MDISVVIPVYNRAKMIKKAFESLKNQTIKNFEVIIVDDGSSDNLLDVVEYYKNSLSIRYYNVTHCGNIAYLRNYGLRKAAGEYIAILDSDDWCVPERLEKQYNYMIKNSDTDILASWVFLEDEFQSENTKRLEWLYNMHDCMDEVIDRCLNDGCCICNSTVMMKKSRIVELGGYDERMKICEDFNLCLRAIQKFYIIKILQERLVVRKIHKQSVTEGYNGKESSIRLVIKNKVEYLKQMGKLDKKIYIWGINSRNSILIDELKKVTSEKIEFEMIDLYKNVPNTLNESSYHLITTYSKREDVFDYLEKKGLKKTIDFIYA